MLALVIGHPIEMSIPKDPEFMSYGYIHYNTIHRLCGCFWVLLSIVTPQESIFMMGKDMSILFHGSHQFRMV